MESEATATYPVGGDDPLFPTGSPLDIDALFAQITDACNMDDLLRFDESAGHAPPDLQSAGETSHSTIAGLRQPVLYPLGSAGPTAATGAGILHEQNAHPELDSREVNAAPGLYQSVPMIAAGAGILHQQSAHTEWEWPGIINPGVSQTQLPPYSVGDPSTSTIGAGTEEMLQSGSALLGFNYNMQVVNAALTIPPVVNAGLAHPQPDPYSTGYSTCPSTTTDMGTSSPDLEVNAGAGLPQSGGGALTEAPVRASFKRKKLARGSSSQRPTPEFSLVEFEAGLIQSDPSFTDIKPPDGSTPFEIIQFLKREAASKLQSPIDIRFWPDTYGKKVNRSLAEEDQTAPKAVRSYVTTVEMMPDQKPHDLGCWKEKEVKAVQNDRVRELAWLRPYAGLKKTFQFQTYDGTKTNWFMDEYIPTSGWGIDLYMERLRFRVVYKGAEVPGEPTSPKVKIKNIIAAVKHRMRGPDGRVVKGESPAWQHLIKIYDRHPELEGSKVVYAVCCHCEGVLKAGTENGTKSLLNHCDRTCPVKNKNQQPRSSR